ncbi:MAG: alpha/beta fold hydrolase, partial [Myxococcales bacterium]|nr:alpha/beta fold hydrolase [Myxococcales bacterium]
MEHEPSSGWRPPPTFDGFDLIRPLGQGGMGSVWLGRDPALERPVALKLLLDGDADERARGRLVSEARALARLHHANVAAVYRVGDVEGRPYIAYEFVDGLSLAEIRRPQPWQRVLELGLGIARGLAAAHRQGILHRDVKPANIVLTRAGAPKLIDFGIAKVRGRSDDEDLAATADAGATGRLTAHGDVTLTDEGRLVGTPLYMAPELWQGDRASESCDLYALGLVLYELLCGELPFARLSGAALIAQILSAELPSPLAACRDLPPAFADVIVRLTRHAAGDRYRDADAVVDALEVIRSLYRPLVDAPTEEREAAELRRLGESFHAIRARRAELGAHFYDSLFASHPELRPLFPADMHGQQQKLVGALEVAVQNASRREALVPFLEDLGRRHVDYGVVPEHFEVAGHQLLASLAHVSGPAWDDDLARIWATAYDHLAHLMIRGLTQGQARYAETVDFVAPTPTMVPPTRWNLPVGPPATRYARNGAVSIAYQVIGSAPLDLVVLPGFVSHLESSWEHPRYATFLRRLASFARVILIDRRGTGLSDRMREGLSLDEQVDDVCGVLDAVGVDRAAIFGLSGGGVLGAALAALRPERVRALCLHGCAARTLAGPDFPEGLPTAAYEGLLAQVRESWGGPLFIEGGAPSLAGDAEFREWWSRYLRAGASPGAAELVLRHLLETDIRELLPTIAAPTLVLHRSGDALVPTASGRAMAAAIPAARFVELDGIDHLPRAGDADAVVAAVH